MSDVVYMTWYVTCCKRAIYRRAERIIVKCTSQNVLITFVCIHGISENLFDNLRCRYIGIKRNRKQ